MKQKLVLCLLALLIAGGVTYGMESGEKEELQKNIAEHVLRFHVLANSDREEDQQLKLQVKDRVIRYLSEYLANEELSLEEAKEIVNERKEEVLRIAQEVIRENGYDYTVTAEIETTYFPVKAYGDLIFPAGEYEAFRIQIGEAEGKNWWCMLYPPLCFVDVTYGYVPDASKETLEQLLEKDAYELITEGGMEEGKIEIRSKILDLIASFR